METTLNRVVSISRITRRIKESKEVFANWKKIHNCIIHQIHNLKNVPYKDLKALVSDLKADYAAVDEPSAQGALDLFAQRWDKKYPKIR